MSGVRPLDQQALYAATKAAVIHLGVCLARELAPRGIRVNTVSPGPTDTPILLTVVAPEQVPEIQADLRARIPLRRLADPGEVARAITWLAAAEFATGSNLVLDGGYTAR